MYSTKDRKIGEIPFTIHLLPLIYLILVYTDMNRLDISRDRLFKGEERRQKIHVYFHDLPVVTPAAKKTGVREIAWITRFRDGHRRACAFEFVKDRVYGLLFHPEGKKESWSIIYNFYDNVCMSSSSSS